jgi:hypothetical protein
VLGEKAAICCAAPLLAAPPVRAALSLMRVEYLLRVERAAAVCSPSFVLPAVLDECAELPTPHSPLPTSGDSTGLKHAEGGGMRLDPPAPRIHICREAERGCGL